tara:strand:+ start:705 stop:2087 length:1383 start_codon:yes stop_codon:yes gene_type:complete
MDELKFLAIENIFEEVRDEVVYIKMKYLLIQKYNGNHPSNKIVSAVDAEMFIHNRYNPEDFEKQLTWKYEYEILEESILKYGMKEPICVKPLLDMGDYHSPDYQMLDGSHRMVCIKHILLTQYPHIDINEVLIPCILREDFDKQQHEFVKKRHNEFDVEVVTNKLKYRGAVAVPDKRVSHFWNTILEKINTERDDCDNVLFFQANTISQGFCNVFDKYIKASEYNKLSGLDDFQYKAYINGTSQAFDSFWMRHHSKRFRTFQGEFFYHKANWKKYHDWLPIEMDDIKENDAVIISLPFSDYCKEHPKMKNILDECEKLNVPVLVDCAWYLIAKNINFDFSKYSCIEDITFSLSKSFHQANKLRAGVRYSRKYHDDNIHIMNEWKQYNHLAAYIGIKLLEEFEPDYAWKRWGDESKKFCKEHNLEQSDCVGFAFGGNEYKEFNRGTEVNRLCISKLIGDDV